MGRKFFGKCNGHAFNDAFGERIGSQFSAMVHAFKVLHIHGHWYSRSDMYLTDGGSRLEGRDRGSRKKQRSKHIAGTVLVNSFRGRYNITNCEIPNFVNELINLGETLQEVS